MDPYEERIKKIANKLWNVIDIEKIERLIKSGNISKILSEKVDEIISKVKQEKRVYYDVEFYDLAKRVSEILKSKVGD